MLNYTATYRCRDKKLCDNILISTFLDELNTNNPFIRKEGDNKDYIGNKMFETIGDPLESSKIFGIKENSSKFASGKSLPPYVVTYKTTAD